MKRFFLFSYDNCYPDGGMHDFAGDFDSVEEARSAGTGPGSRDNYQIFDYSKKVVVETNDPSIEDIYSESYGTRLDYMQVRRVFLKSAFK